jgi:fibronectin type 3 domain-containing protein
MSVFTSTYALVLDELIVATVKANNANGASAASTANVAGATAKSVPTTAPALSRGAATSDTQVVLTWTGLSVAADTGSSAITNYKLYYDNGDGAATTFSLLGSTGGATSFTQNAGAGGISAGVTYRYQILASNVYGDGTKLPLVASAFSTLAAAVPDQLAASTTVLSGGSVVVTWAVSPNVHGSAVTDYRITFKNAGGVFSAYATTCDGTQAGIISAKTCTVAMTVFSSGLYSLTIGAPIIAVVEAHNAVGYSTPSAENAVYAAVKLVPQEAPVLARGASTNEYQVQLTWAAINPANNGGSAATGYKILWDNGAGAGSTTVLLATIASAGTASYTQTSSLTPGSTYNYLIQAVNVIGTGISSSTFAVTVAAAAEQLAPCTTTLSALKARITWTATTSTHGSAVTAYKIQIKKADGTPLESAECDGTDGTIFGQLWCEVAMSTLTGVTYALTAGTPIIAQVSALNAGGYSTYSIDNTAYITAIREPLAAPVASIASHTETSITVQWALIAATTASNGGSVVTDYVVEFSSDGTTFATPVTVNGINTLTYVDSPGTPGSTYYYRVSAVNAFGTSLVPSNVASALAAQVPDQITPAPVLTMTGTDVTVTWSASPDVHSSTVTAYRITFLQNSPATYVASATSCLGAGTTTTCDIPMTEFFQAPYSLAYLTNIYAKVEALNAVGYSTISAAGTGVTVLTYPLDAPVLTRNAGTSTTDIIVDWSAIATSGGAAVTGYELLVLSGASYTLVATAIAPTTYTHSGRTPGTTYTYKLRALNAYSVVTEAYRGTLSAALPVIAATVADQLAAATTANVGTNVVISWAVTGNANSSPVTAYRILIKVSGGGSYQADTANCDGSTYNVWANVQCTIPMSVFTITPFSLSPNDQIIATVEALNGVGYSPVSVDNTVFANVKVKPTAAPTVSNGAGTSNTQVEITWPELTASADIGYSAVTSYNIYYQVGTFVYLANVASQVNPTNSYIHTPITAGQSYTYQIAAVNIFGEGVASASSAAILASLAPLKLAAATVIIIGGDVRVLWPATTDDYGSGVLDYKILFKDKTVNYVESPNCDGTAAFSISNRSCSLAMAYFTTTMANGGLYELSTGTPVIAAVEARNGIGYSIQSDDNTVYGVA